jgi:hypothetical protein
MALSLASPLAFAAPAQAHPGGLDANGCHTNHKTGEYHCHRPQGRPPARAPSRSGGGIYYANCSEARAAGAAPIRRGEPGYRAALDRDDDGVACE